jgi:hypothetical protein
MNKRLKFFLIAGITAFMLITWAVIFFSHSVGKPANNWWQVGMSASALLFGVFGMLTAAKWSWLKSGVGRSVFLMSAAVFMWGVGNSGWTYYLFRDPNQQNPPAHLLDILYSSAIPLWFVGVIMLSKATGARYGLRSLVGKIFVVAIILIMSIASWYLLVEVARGGVSYFKLPFWEQFFDLGYSVGDAINATIAIALFALSWKLLGGRFKIPILTILAAFVTIYFADFLWSYLSGKNEYFNGDVADLLYMTSISAFGLGINMLDPGTIRKAAVVTLPPVETTINQAPPSVATQGVT